MKITITVEVNEEGRMAIAADDGDWETLDVDPAPKRAVEIWMRSAVRGALTALMEKFDDAVGRE
jgi:hypothetical protein